MRDDGCFASFLFFFFFCMLVLRFTFYERCGRRWRRNVKRKKRQFYVLRFTNGADQPKKSYEMKGIVYRDACAGETNGAWGSRV